MRKPLVLLSPTFGHPQTLHHRPHPLPSCQVMRICSKQAQTAAKEPLQGSTIMSRNATTSNFPNKSHQMPSFRGVQTLQHPPIRAFAMSLNLAAPPGTPGAKASPGRLPAEGGDGATETGACFSIKIMGLNMMKPSNIYQTMENMETYHQNMENIWGYD